MLHYAVQFLFILFCLPLQAVRGGGGGGGREGDRGHGGGVPGGQMVRAGEAHIAGAGPVSRPTMSMAQPTPMVSRTPVTSAPPMVSSTAGVERAVIQPTQTVARPVERPRFVERPSHIERTEQIVRQPSQEVAKQLVERPTVTRRDRIRPADQRIRDLRPARRDIRATSRQQLVSDQRFAKAQRAALQNPQKVSKWNKDWRRFRNFHHHRRFDPALFWLGINFFPWLWVPYGYWWNNYWSINDVNRCWLWRYGAFGRYRYWYPCYWDYGYAQEIRLVEYVQQDKLDDAIAKLEARIAELEARLAELEDESQKEDLENDLKEAQWLIDDIRRAQENPQESESVE